LEATLLVVLARPNTAEIVWDSAPMRIGKHYWRVTLKPSSYGKYSTMFQWFGAWDSFWHDDTSWPTFDGNESNGGMPDGIKTLWKKNEAAIKLAMTGNSPATLL